MLAHIFVGNLHFLFNFEHRCLEGYNKNQAATPAPAATTTMRRMPTRMVRREKMARVARRVKTARTINILELVFILVYVGTNMDYDYNLNIKLLFL